MGVLTGATSTINIPSKNKSGMGGVLSSILGAGSNLLGGILNEAFSDKHTKDAQNFALMQGDIDWQRQQQAFNMANTRADEVWNRQRQWDVDKWNMENQYNSPSAQMSRFKEAGLNPHLIYGQSNTGGNIASGNLGSGNISGTSGHAPNRASNSDWISALSGIGNSLMNYVEFKKEAETVDNVQAQTELTRKEGILKGVQTAGEILKNKGILHDNTRKSIENYIQNELKDVSVDAGKASLKKIEQEMDLNSKRNDREVQKTIAEIKMLGQQVLESKSREEVNKLQKRLQQLQIQLLEVGPRATELIDRTMGGVGKEIYDAAQENKQRFFRNYKPGMSPNQVISNMKAEKDGTYILNPNKKR